MVAKYYNLFRLTFYRNIFRYLGLKNSFASYMKKNLLSTLFISLFIIKLSFAQLIATPAVEWSQPFYGGSRGGTASSIAGPNVIFTMLTNQFAQTSSVSISKFDANGSVKTQAMPSELTKNPAISQYACQDGGILVSNSLNRWMRKYDANMNLVWERIVSYSLNNATATLSNGFYIFTKSFINNKNIIELKRVKEDGSIQWSNDITSFTSNITDIQTTSDDGVIVGTENGLRKYSVTGQLLWNNLSIINATKFIPLDANTMYVQIQNSSLSNILGILQINTQNGSAIWTKSFNTESIFDFEITKDKGCAVMTNTGLYKFKTNGEQEWKNTQYTSSLITTTGDGGIIIVNNNRLIKLSIGNEFNWVKTFSNGYNLDVYGASDNGLFVIASRPYNSVTTNYIDTYLSIPNYFIFKIASPDTPCKMNFDISGNDATFCTSGSLLLGYKLGNTTNTSNSPFVDFNFQWNQSDKPITTAISNTYYAETAGKYSLTLTQGTCQSTTKNIEMKVIKAPVIQVVESRICQGQTANITSTGCEGIVVWSNGERGSILKVTPQTTSTYNAYCETNIINANGVSELCKTALSNTIIISVSPFSNLKIEEIKGKKEFCETGTTTLEAVTSGGIQSFIYTWQKNNAPVFISPYGVIKINQEGNYQLLLTDSRGCSVSSEIFSVKKILNPATPNIVAQGLTEICSGSNVTLTTDAKEASYQWLKNEKPINDAIGQSYKAESSGVYKVQVLNSTGCSTTSVQSITINEVVVPQPFIKQSNDTLISSYLNENKWFFNGSQLAENGYKIKFNTTGNYEVKAVFKGCESVTSPIFNPIILANENSIANVSIYPNPVSNNLVISSPELVKYKFFNILGRILKEEQGYKTQFDIDVSTLNDGEYLLLLQGINQKEYSRKIVIRK